MTPRGVAGRAAARRASARASRLELVRAVASTAVAAAAAAAVMLAAAGPVAAHGEVPAQPPDIGILLTAWSFDPSVAVPLIATALAWLWAVRRIERRHRPSPVPPLRVISFLAGLATIGVALQSGIERYDTTLFSIHMVQHLLLVFVAPPLLLLGAPVTVVLRVASPWLRRRLILPLLHSSPVRFLSHPVTAWLGFTGVMWVTHFSPLFDAALEDQGIHDLEHVLFVVSALLFWFPIVGADPSPNRLGFPARILYLLLQMPPSSFLAMAILFDDGPLYDHYQALGAPYGTTALADQQSAAGIMWVSTDLVLIGAILLVVAAWMRHDEARTVEVERRIDMKSAALAGQSDALAPGRAAPRSGRPALRPGGVPGQAGSGEASSSR